MGKIIKTIIELYTDSLLSQKIFVFIGIIIVVLFNFLRSNILLLVTHQQLALTTLILLFIFFLLSAYSIGLYRKLYGTTNMNNFYIVELRGFYKHKKEDGYWCSKCLLDHGPIRSRLVFLVEKGLVCNNCDTLYLRPISYNILKEEEKKEKQKEKL